MYFLYLITIIFVLLLPYIINNKSKRNGKNLPGPFPLPYIGNAHLLLGDGGAFLRTFHNFWKTYGSTYKFYIGNELLVVLTNPDDVEVILSNANLIRKSDDYKFIKPWLGTGLILSTGEEWRKHRKVITPTFHFKILENFVQIFNTNSHILINRLKSRVDKQSFDISSYISSCSLDIVSEAAMGMSVNAQKNLKSDYSIAVKEICRVIHGRVKNPIKRIDALFYLTKDYKVQKDCLKILHGYTDEMILKRKQYLEEHSETFLSYTSDDLYFGIKKKLAFLDMLLLSTIDGKPLTDLEIRDEVQTFLFAGHDTTTLGISYGLYMLAHNPHVQQKVFEEQQNIFGEDMKRSAMHADLQSMKYLEMVIKETLRMFPPVPYIARNSDQDIEINGISIPSGSTIMILIYSMNHNPAVFPNPSKFDPERFSADEINKRSPFSSVVFSAGPRNCLGQKFSMLEMKDMISKIVRNYELLPSNEKLVLISDITLKSTSGMKIKLGTRQ